MKIETITKNKDLVLDSFQAQSINSLVKMPIIKIYKYPSDYPNHYIARLFNQRKPTNMITKKDSLEEIRKTIPWHMAKIGVEDKDKNILEVYI